MVLHFCAAGEGFVFWGEEVVHFLAGHEDRAPARDGGEFVACAVVVAESQRGGLGDMDGHEGCDPGRVEVVERGVDVPAVKARYVSVVLVRDRVGVEGFVVRVLERDILQPLKLVHVPVPDHLDLRLVRNSLQIRVQDGLFGVESFAVAVAGYGWVEHAREFILGFGREVLLAFEQQDLVGVESAPDGVEVCLVEVLEVCVADFGA